jgi:hypothetical protein
MLTRYTPKDISDILDDTESRGNRVPIIQSSGASFPFVGRAVSTIIFLTT